MGFGIEGLLKRRQKPETRVHASTVLGKAGRFLGLVGLGFRGLGFQDCHTKGQAQQRSSPDWRLRQAQKGKRERQGRQGAGSRPSGGLCSPLHQASRGPSSHAPWAFPLGASATSEGFGATRPGPPAWALRGHGLGRLEQLAKRLGRRQGVVC